MDIIMECKNVDYSYPLTTEPAIKHLNLQIERGKFYGVIGENGSGKTTLCALLRGFAPSFYKGEMQRVALASVIVLEPDILIIDEPTSQLDPEGTESVFAIIKAMKDKQKTIILVEHKIDLIAEYADDVLVLKDGELIAVGDKNEILTDITLMEKGVALPQVVLLAVKLQKAGLPLTKIPVTEKQAIEMIGQAMKEKRG